MLVKGSGVPCIVAALAAPLVGVRTRQPMIHHAIEMDEVTRVWLDGKTATAACGARHIRPLAFGTDRLVVLWPERVDSLPEGVVRCRACHELTGKQRPRSKYVPAQDAGARGGAAW